MSSYEKFYMEKLYPLQDGVMNIIKKLSTPFFLTGGTALSRHYFNHRYSDDIDLFVNSDADYHKWVEQILTTLIDYEPQSDIIVDRTSIKRFKDFTQFFVSRPDDTASLKIDMVNDVAPRYGDFVTNKILGKTDSWENIL